MEPPSDNASELPSCSSIEQFTKDGFAVLMDAIKQSNALPAGRDWDFYCTSENFKKIINEESNNVLGLMNTIMGFHDIDKNVKKRVLDEKVELIVEANDTILEKVANNIDEMNGIHKNVPPPVIIQTVSAELPVNGSWNKITAAKYSVNKSNLEDTEPNCVKLITAKNIIRPQKVFKDKIDNRNKVPWCPRISEKPNSLKPLAIFLEEYEDRQEYSHPYEYELDRFKPTDEQLMFEKPEKPKSLSDTPLVEISEEDQLEELVETLRNCSEFGVDVEHHSYRSFMGITCLLQISTNETDYLIDTITLRDKLHILNEVFTKNTITKIFHGAEKDIEWLQRDLSIYVVNMFDTHQAAKCLQYPALSLAYLLRKFCNVIPNKQFQLADWRMRPLPDQLKKYAREDTHYLIYVYKLLKKELLFKGNNSDKLLLSAIERSTDICKKRYFKPMMREDSYLDLYRKCKKLFDNRQLYALREIFAWRDSIAREEDESCAYVLPNHMLLQISETLPREMQGILACCNPIPPLVRAQLLELHHIVLRAREQPLEKAILTDTTARGTLKKVSKINVDSILHCPHDFHSNHEFRDDLPTLLHNDKCKLEINTIRDNQLSIENTKVDSVFNQSVFNFNGHESAKNIWKLPYFSPYERYNLIKSFVAAEDEKKKEEKEKSKEDENQEQVTENDGEVRTDEDRISSIRDHFLQLSRKFNEELEMQNQREEEEAKRQRERERSLLEIGGSMKRKRNDHVEVEQFHEIPDLTLPAPSLTPQQYSSSKKNRNRGKKRKFEEMHGTPPNQPQTPNNQNKQQKKKRWNKSKNLNKPQNTNQANNLNQPQHYNQANNLNQQQHYNQGNNLNQPRRYNQANNLNQQQHCNQANNLNQPQQYNESNIQNKGNVKKTKKPRWKKNSTESNFNPYDYASVDFRQFQGGAGINQGMQLKSKFKGKKQKPTNKNQVKSATFGNTRYQRGGKQKGG